MISDDISDDMSVLFVPIEELIGYNPLFLAVSCCQ